MTPLPLLEYRLYFWGSHCLRVISRRAAQHAWIRLWRYDTNSNTKLNTEAGQMVCVQLRESQEYRRHNAIAANAHEGKSIFPLCPHARKQPTSQQRTAAMQPNFDVFLGNVERRSRF